MDDFQLVEDLTTRWNHIHFDDDLHSESWREVRRSSTITDVLFFFEKDNDVVDNVRLRLVAEQDVNVTHVYS